MTNKNDVFDRAINNFKYVSSKRAYHYEQKFRYLPFWLSESSYIFKKEANNQLNKPYPYFKRGAVIRVNFGVNEGSEQTCVLMMKQSPMLTTYEKNKKCL